MTSRRDFLALAPGLLAPLSSMAQQAGTDSMLRFNTTQGLIDIQLYDTGAPNTVANFLGYVRRKSYEGSIFHRSVPGFIVQAGGFAYTDASRGITAVPAQVPVINEFSATRSNVRGTVAMAKLGGNPNSATNQWFVNLANNSSNLDTQNGGFSVFGRVTTSGMVVFDAIARLRTIDYRARSNNGALGELPVVNFTGTTVLPDNVVRVLSVTELGSPATLSDSDRVFNYLEATYPQFASPADSGSGNALGYYYRYYRGTNSYVGTQGGSVFYLVPALSPDITRLGSLADWLAIAAAEGY
ncbi:peptidylprolyl isomerase [Ideonella sp. A 288]|uniref:peptidylprolyl isomerase n=1 Tax=Ideonella sp. A 288 TaxID=1962181 RepID=UPI0018FEBB16|nr:peptidylprolyl isomerase [Ideonella sp. A 288]